MELTTSTVVGLLFLREDFGAAVFVLDDRMAAIRLEDRSDVCPSWRLRRFPSDVELEPLTEREGAKGAVSMVDVVASDITASSSGRWLNVFRARREGILLMMTTMTMIYCWRLHVVAFYAAKAVTNAGAEEGEGGGGGFLFLFCSMTVGARGAGRHTRVQAVG